MEKFYKIFKQYYMPICLILILSFTRLVPHPWNFTPILAAGVFSGFYFKNLYLSIFIAIFAMFIGDLYLGFHSTMFFTYVSLIAAVGIGCLIKYFKLLEILLGGLASSVIFFIITNFGAWLTLDMYEKNITGLLKSYTLAVPFFHNTLISTLLYLILLKLIFDFSTKKKIFQRI